MTTRTAQAPRRQIARLLKSLEPAATTVRYTTSTTIFAQGDPCAGVMYIEKGRVKLLATSEHGRQAAVDILGAGAVFGEGALAGQRRRRTTAETMTNCTIMIVKTAPDAPRPPRGIGSLRGVSMAPAGTEHSHRGRCRRPDLQWL